MKKERKMAMVVTKVTLHDRNQSFNDTNYWLSKTPLERLSAVTVLIKQTLKPGQRMDKTIFRQLELKK